MFSSWFVNEGDGTLFDSFRPASLFFSFVQYADEPLLEVLGQGNYFGVGANGLGLMLYWLTIFLALGLVVPWRCPGVGLAHWSASSSFLCPKAPPIISLPF